MYIFQILEKFIDLETLYQAKLSKDNITEVKAIDSKLTTLYLSFKEMLENLSLAALEELMYRIENKITELNYKSYEENIKIQLDYYNYFYNDEIKPLAEKMKRI